MLFILKTIQDRVILGKNWNLWVYSIKAIPLWPCIFRVPAAVLNFGRNGNCHLSQKLYEIERYWANLGPPG